MVCVEVDGWLWADEIVAFAACAAFVTVVMGDEDGLVVFAACAVFATVVMGIEVESSFWVSRGGGIWCSR